MLADARSKDPIARAQASFIEARKAYAADEVQKPQLAQAIAAVLSTRDPLLIDTLGLHLITYRDPAAGRTSFVFDRHYYPLGAPPDVGLALFLAPCELGLKCDSTEPHAQLRCASGAGCEGGRYEEAKRMLNGQPGQYEKVVALASRIADAAKTGNAKAFTP